MGYKGPLGIVEPGEFRNRTAGWTRRTGEILMVDAAYDAYYSLRSEDNALKLHKALHQYLVTHGKYWSDIRRNTDSGGLLEHLYNFTKPAAPFAAVPPEQRANRALQTLDIPHSQYGVLYLLGSIDIELDIFSLGLEGVGAIGGAVGAGIGTNFPAAARANTQLEITNSSRDAFSAFGTPIKTTALSIGGQSAAKVGAALVSNGGSVAARPVVAPPAPDRTSFPCSVATLNAIATAIPDAYQHNRFFTMGAAVLATPVAVTGAFVADVGVNLARAGAALYQKIKDALEAGWESIKKKMLADGSWKYEQIATLAKAALKFVLDHVMKSIAPVVGAALELGSGLVKTVEESCKRIASYLDRRKIHLTPGHPEEIANSIEHSMTMGILSGLANTLKGAGKLAVQTFAPGLGSVVSAILTGLEWLVKFIYRVWESIQIKSFLTKVRAHFVNERKLGRLKVGETVQETLTHSQTVGLRNAATGEVSKSVTLTFKSGPLAKTSVVSETVNNHTAQIEPNLKVGSILTDTAAFTTLFREGCNASPVIPMLVLNTGICGSLMTMVRLFDDTGEMESNAQQQFDTASQFFARLKEHGASYLRSTGFQFKPINLDDNFLIGILRHAVDHHNPANSVLSNVAAVVRA